MKKELLLLPIAGLAACNTQKQLENTKPNIILILADDLGYSDLGCYGSEIQTPNLDSLASNGVRCSHFYNASRSCPSRASLMTGLYPHQAGMGHMSNGLKLKPNNENIESYQGFLPGNVPTIADLLSSAGYHTCISGKWHVGDKREHWPDKHGFAHGWYIPDWGSAFFSTPGDTMKLFHDGGWVYYPDTNAYLTDILTDNAISMLNEVPGGKPYFLYLAYNAPHTPLQAPDSIIEKYMPLYKDGWDRIREDRFAKQKRLGLLPEYIEKPGDLDLYAEVSYDWSRLNEKEKWFMQRTMAAYAAMIDRMDQNIGRLLQSLKESGKLENTVIMFLSDNGGTHEGWNYSHTKNMDNAIPGSKNFWGGPGPWWGRVSNTPFRMFKSHENEGGISSPLIISCSKYFPQNAIIRNGYFHIMDVLPTCIELAGVKYPDTYNGKPVKEVFHQSMLSYLSGIVADTISERLMCWEHQGQIAIRKGRWKLSFIREFYYFNPFIREHKSEMVNSWGLYDMEKDPYENDNLYEKYPDVVNELKSDYADWAKKTGVVDWGRVNIWK